MKITVLVENTPKDQSIRAEHGLSFFIETRDKTILLDAGQKDLFLENAALLGRDIGSVDYAVLSHGHGDHGGGLPAFRKTNPCAPIYMARSATRRCYVRKFGFLYFNVGLDREFVSDQGIVLLDADRELSPGIHAMVEIPRKADYLTTSSNLFMRKGWRFERDDFSHELALVIREGERVCVFSSCSHRGLHNIMGRVAEKGLLGKQNLVFTGMHLFDPVGKRTEKPALLDRFADDLAAFDATTYYAGHCTGAAAFERLKTRLGERIQPLRCGDVYEV
jgi:7,8-dihydropterin-6-yl-methyl-4-(beta-D-ribofuranosyl)aminobenzene 5'-phosphate synthase